MKVFLPILVLLFTVVTFSQEIVTKEYLMGNYEPSKDVRFEIYKGYYLRKETLEAFIKLEKDAKKNGITLNIISATRTFSHQKRLWETKWKKYYSKKLGAEKTAQKVLNYSSMPTSSRHHWGTDMDIISLDPKYWLTKKGQSQYAWLTENAPKHGFCQPYSANRPTGYKEEKWHWSYKPVAQNLLKDYENKITLEDISASGFLGSQTALTLNVIEDYVFGINQTCR